MLADQSAPALPDLLAQLAERDPRLGVIASYLARARAETAIQEDTEAMTAELAALRERSGVLAHALGACEHCWGTDPQCRGCRGTGGPGTFLPDPALFQELVVPAIRRARRHHEAMTPRKRRISNER